MNSLYPYLPDDGTIAYVSDANVFMAEAKKTCLEKSTDHYHPTGAVVVKDGVILGKGANQSALRNKHLLSLHKRYFCLRRFFNVKSGEKYWVCPGCASAVMHAETRAVRDALKSQQTLAGCELYLWGHWWCCKPCWDSMLGADLHKVYLVNEATALFKK